MRTAANIVDPVQANGQNAQYPNSSTMATGMMRSLDQSSIMRKESNYIETPPSLADGGISDADLLALQESELLEQLYASQKKTYVKLL